MIMHRQRCAHLVGRAWGGFLASCRAWTGQPEPRRWSACPSVWTRHCTSNCRTTKAPRFGSCSSFRLRSRRISECTRCRSGAACEHQHANHKVLYIGKDGTRLPPGKDAFRHGVPGAGAEASATAGDPAGSTARRLTRSRSNARSSATCSRLALVRAERGAGKKRRSSPRRAQRGARAGRPAVDPTGLSVQARVTLLHMREPSPSLGPRIRAQPPGQRDTPPPPRPARAPRQAALPPEAPPATRRLLHQCARARGRGALQTPRAAAPGAAGQEAAGAGPGEPPPSLSLEQAAAAQPPALSPRLQPHLRSALRPAARTHPR